MSKWEGDEEIEIFREYLRIPSVHPNVDYEPCVKFLQKQAKSLELPLSIVYPVNEKNPVVILTWHGSDPKLPSIMLNSHMDVVPVFEDLWSHPPFAAEIDKDGKIYARGAQDMKNVGMQYLAAIRALKKDGVKQFKRTIHGTFMPDEEVNSEMGMKPFVKSEAFRELNVGFVLDEACASPIKDNFLLFYGERSGYAVELIYRGQSGHGAAPLQNTPGEKVRYLLDKFMDFRNSELRKLAQNPKLFYGDVTGVNLTMMNGGVQTNVVPAEIKMVFDIRLAVDVNDDEFMDQINRWCEEAGGDVTVNRLSAFLKPSLTRTDDSNIFWTALKSAADELEISLTTVVCPGNTDARYIRDQKIPAFGFTPIKNTPMTLHDHDEFIFADSYLEGINIYKNIISRIADA